ncbi:hypothetical protein B0A48_15538 [Cryoendolithus antarcticus]|uniref:Uncharacterized protein n=1 Tax=Cryoendolithus antarcticus TaxID=1507870 RepID=A0A1V8SGH1_9PEZI|nr:hypothetical protein B0A48_15538 [Cryoendolithus antarcticus]
MSNTIHIFSLREQLVANARPLFRSLQPSRILVERNIDSQFDVVIVRPDGGYRAMITWQSVHHVDHERHQFVYGPGNPSPAGALAALFAETVRLLTEARGWVATVRTDVEIISTQGASLVTMDTAVAQGAQWQQVAGQGTGAGSAPAPSNVQVTRNVAPGAHTSQAMNGSTAQTPSGAAAVVVPLQATSANFAQASHSTPSAKTPGDQAYTQRPHNPHTEKGSSAAFPPAKEAAPGSAKTDEVKKEEKEHSDDEMSTQEE